MIRRNKLFATAFWLIIAIKLTVIAGMIIIGWTVFNNPIIIGEFFGRIINGFNSTK